jgi:hypothetical protein
MQEHINAFTKLQQEVNYHRKSPLSDVDVNLAFLQSLGEDWRTFQQSLGSRLHALAPPMLFAEVLAFDSANNPAPPTPYFPRYPHANTGLQGAGRGSVPTPHHERLTCDYHVRDLIFSANTRPLIGGTAPDPNTHLLFPV